MSKQSCLRSVLAQRSSKPDRVPVEVGKTYYFKHHIPHHDRFPESVQEYVVRIREKDHISSSAWKVEILATTHKKVEDGIQDSDYWDWREQQWRCTNPWFRIFYMGETWDEDWEEIIREFDEKDIPLCLGWAYCSDKLVGVLTGKDLVCKV
jgi:hypothetical protein